VKPETVIGWHRAGFRLYWRWRARPRGGRPRTTAEIHALIRAMAEENVGWGAPKIHGELRKLGFTISERTVAQYLRRVRRGGDPGKRWSAFLQNHREVIVAFDFFTVPTVTFKHLYCFFVIEHGRRKILHFNVTRHPRGEWIVQQLREAFPEAGPYRYAIYDRDSKFDADVLAFLKATGLKPEQTSWQAPWQSGLSERKMGGELPPRDPRPFHRPERAASPPADPRLRDLPSRRSYPRLLGKGHPESTASGKQASSERERAFNAAPGWPAPSLRLAQSGIALP